VYLYPYGGVKFGREVRTLITKSRHLYVVGISTGVVDRIDKLAIGFFLPLEVLGKYALTSGILAFSRFLPDAIAKSIFFEREEKKSQRSRIFPPRKNITIFSSSLILSMCASEAIVYLFGEEWNLPFTFTLLFALQELVRALYQMSISNMLLSKGADIVPKAALYLLLLSLTLMPFLTLLIGIYGPPVSLILAYLTMYGYVSLSRSKGGNN
jgi:O-antigen/teichoic acid export membrane protein